MGEEIRFSLSFSLSLSFSFCPITNEATAPPPWQKTNREKTASSLARVGGLVLFLSGFRCCCFAASLPQPDRCFEDQRGGGGGIRKNGRAAEKGTNRRPGYM